MSVKDYNKTIIVIDAMTGDIIEQIDRVKYSGTTLDLMLQDLFNDYVLLNERGLIIKIGYKNQWGVTDIYNKFTNEERVRVQSLWVVILWVLLLLPLLVLMD